MKIRPWPLHSFVIETLLPLQTTLDMIQANIQPRQFFRPSSENKYFEGELVGSHFNVKRIIRYRNSFLPVVLGSVESDGAKTLIKVRMRLNHFVFAFMSVWFVVFGAGCILATNKIVNGTVNYPSLDWITLAMLLSMAILALGSFWYEALAQEVKLRSLLTPPKP